MPCLPPILRAFFCIVRIVATLAKCGQIKKAAIFRAMVVDVRNRKYNGAAGNGMRLVIFRTAPLTAIFCTVKADKPGPQFPVARIAFTHFRTNRHFIFLYVYNHQNNG